MEAEEERVNAMNSKFEKAYAQAYRLAFSKEDFMAARNTLEAAFRTYKEQISNTVLFKAKVLQTEVFFSLNQNAKAKETLLEVNHVQLTEAEKESLIDVIERFEELRLELN